MTPEQLQRFEQFIEQWEGTPYLSGQCMAGPAGGVDCLRYVDQGLQAIKGVSLVPLPREAQDAAFHDRRVVVFIGLLMMKRHGLKTIGIRPPFKVADILCVRTKTPTPLKPENRAEKNPHHIMLVGPGGIRVWHAGPSQQVSWMGLGGVVCCYDIIHAWRME